MQHASDNAHEAGRRHRPTVDCLEQNASVTLLNCWEPTQRTHDTQHTFSSQFAPAVSIKCNIIDQNGIALYGAERSGVGAEEITAPR
jgi:hypothetical protein